MVMCRFGLFVKWIRFNNGCAGVGCFGFEIVGPCDDYRTMGVSAGVDGIVAFSFVGGVEFR